MSALRWSAACGVLAAFAAAILTHEEPGVLLVGLLPVAWLAVELVWRGLESPAGAPQAATREPLKRTGMRRWPNGLPNFW